MSWVFGVIGRAVDDRTAESCQAIHGDPLGTYYNAGRSYIAAGGLPLTCQLSRPGTHRGLDSFAITLGCAFRNTGPEVRHLTQNDWKEIDGRNGSNAANEFEGKAGSNAANEFTGGSDAITALDGHFVHLLATRDRIEIRNDQLGQRTLYWYESPGEVVVSSRLDWISRYVGGLRINFSALGSRWLIFNQLTYDCPADGVMRLGPSARLVISPSGVRCTDAPFAPAMDNATRPEHLVDLLRRYIDPVMDNTLRISLGLSGGIDSRVLLSLMLETGRNNFSTHTFGSEADPDVSIPQRIAAREHFPHVVCDAPIPDASAVVALLQDFVSQTNLFEPCSTALRLRHYKELDNTRFILMDGGFGEVARRQYLNRLALTGKDAIETRALDGIFQHLRAPRGDLFNPGVKEAMRSGVDAEIGRMLASMPAVSTIGIENYLDLWAVRTRIPNFGSDEQGRLDATILNFMPFAQPGFIRAVFGLPLKHRRDGRLFREIIVRSHTALKKYPLVKNGTTYPFILPTYGSWLWSKAKVKLGCHYQDETVHIVLHHVREFVLDVLHSQRTKEYAPYHYPLIRKNIDGYYAGARGSAAEVNWWLSFELWRRNIERA